MQGPQRIPQLRKLPLILAGLFVTSFTSLAHSATLQGEVRNTQGQPLANTQIRLLSSAGTEIATTQTDGKGQAVFANVAGGHYIVEAKSSDNITSRKEIDIAAANAKVSLVVDAVATVQVTAAHLKSARVELSPKIGTTIYSIDKHMVDMLGQGDSTPFNEVLLRLPGVAQDSKASGGLHVRDDHGNVQYRINGVQLPESITGFGQSIDTRQIDETDFITGALPAQFGLRTAGIVDIQTKEGHTTPGGRIGILAGSNNYYNPSAEFFGTKGAFNYYLSGSYLSNSQGIENPTAARSALHDKTEQAKTFGNLSYFVDDNTRLGMMFGTYNGKFQIPNNPGQVPSFSLAGVSDAQAGTSSLPSSQLNENQREVNRFLVLSFQKTLGDLNYQLSAFHQYSELHFTPDTAGDLVYNGVASDTLRSNSASGLQADVSYKLNPSHTLRSGFTYTRQLTHSDNTVAVFPTDDTGAQTSTSPFNISDNSGKTGNIYSLYAQDEWHISAPLTLNYGVRFDHVSAFVNEQQWSPRLNLAYKLSDDTALHAGYSRYFTPPPQELASQESINLYANTTNAPAVPTSDNVKSERTHYFDVGISHKVNDRLTLTADAYYKNIRNMLDEGQFGQALILSPFNYEKGYAKGLELSAVYNDKRWGAFLNVALQKAQAKNIISGQSLFGPDELAYIANHYIYVDHNQTYSVSGGAHYHFGNSQVSADFLYGSGLRKTPEGGAPNSAALDAYTTVNAAFTHNWKKTAVGDIEGRISLINLFDKSYLLRDGSGVGVGAPQYGARRTLYVGMSTSF
ncbi:TonB-dependent receptor [Undibacterium sp.]|jgi:outer membrane receptor protein involved in Fe transport|uniref:TonB-dependent receptor n=1 Tax=Undibacterium sp. TaxID=1914977 RepID=UPI002BF5379E|nr:TonB-dependent receptor [Undibacterium sp.]HTD04668.1 TonB-dependent receptor [Undibacterium sp.]